MVEDLLSELRDHRRRQMSSDRATSVRQQVIDRRVVDSPLGGNFMQSREPVKLCQGFDLADIRLANHAVVTELDSPDEDTRLASMNGNADVAESSLESMEHVLIFRNSPPSI